MFTFFKLLVRLSHISERVSIRMQPFFTEYGFWLLDHRESHWITKTLLNGAVIRLDLTEKTQRGMYSAYIYERGLSRFLVKTLHPGMLFADVGANVGYFSALAQHQGAAVIAYEPEEQNFKQLQKLGVEAVRACVGNRESTVALYVHPRNRGGNSVVPFERYKSGRHLLTVEHPETQDVPMTRLIIDADVVKIDVEGFEYEVLEGMTCHPQYLICELTRKREECIELLRSRGYTPHYLDKDGTLIVGTKGRDLVFTNQRIATG